MPYTDQIVLVLLLLCLFGSLVYQWRQGLRGGRLALVTFAMFYALSVISALTMHCIDLMYGWSHHLTSFGTGKPFAWNWHLYSLTLFGVLLIWFGVQCLRRALRMGRGDVAARGEFLRLVVVMLAIVLPIIPIQPFFGAIASALSVIALLVVALGGRSATGTAELERYASRRGSQASPTRPGTRMRGRSGGDGSEGVSSMPNRICARRSSTATSAIRSICLSVSRGWLSRSSARTWINVSARSGTAGTSVLVAVIWSGIVACG